MIDNRLRCIEIHPAINEICQSKIMQRLSHSGLRSREWHSPLKFLESFLRNCIRDSAKSEDSKNFFSNENRILEFFHTTNPIFPRYYWIVSHDELKVLSRFREFRAQFFFFDDDGEIKKKRERKNERDNLADTSRLIFDDKWNRDEKEGPTIGGRATGLTARDKNLGRTCDNRIYVRLAES